MDTTENNKENGLLPKPDPSFYERPQVHVERIPIGGGVTVGIERITNPQVGIGGAYGTWGDSYGNEDIPRFFEKVLGEANADEAFFNLSELGFMHRYEQIDGAVQAALGTDGTARRP